MFSCCIVLDPVRDIIGMMILQDFLHNVFLKNRSTHITMSVYSVSYTQAYEGNEY